MPLNKETKPKITWLPLTTCVIDNNVLTTKILVEGVENFYTSI